MKLLALVAVVWITGAFVAIVFATSAARLSRWKEPEPEPDEDLAEDLTAAAELALEDVYGETGPLPPPPIAPSPANLQRQVVRAAVPGERPTPVGVR